MKTFIIMLFALGLLAVMPGCGTTARFVYPADMNTLVKFDDKQRQDKVVAVLPFDDFRSDANEASTFFFYLVPLMPYGWGNYDRPDDEAIFLSIAGFDFNPSEDLAKAAAVSLRRSNLFKDAWFTFGGEKDKADYILTGQVMSTEYKCKVFSYGISLPCPYLWMLGAPAGTSCNRLHVKFALHDKKGQLIWEHSFDREENIMQWLYYRYGQDVKMYAPLMEQAMNEALQNMKKCLSK
ncbi:MAG: hypothetical protein WC071_01290 [Victivallaceae bacterium]